MAPKRDLTPPSIYGSTSDPAEEHRDKRLCISHILSDFASGRPPSSTTAAPSPQKRTVLLPTSRDAKGQHPDPSQPFNLITALCAHTDILIHLVQFIPPKSLVDLHSISAPFHYQFCSHQTSFILSATRIYAPSAETLSPWTQHASLCSYDPAHRLPTYRVPSPSEPASNHLRRIPSLRWLRQSAYRHFVSTSILGHLSLALTTPWPADMASTMCKLWYALSLPLSTLRLSLFRSAAYTTPADLFRLHLLLVKLDLYFTDPISYTGGEVCARRYLLAEPGLTPLWDAVRRPWTRLDALRLWVRHGYTPPVRPETEEAQRKWQALGREEVMGVPLGECGRAGWEMYGLGRRKLIEIEKLVVGEGIRRALGLERYILKMVRYGYIDKRGRAVREIKGEHVLPEVRWRKELEGLRRGEREEQVKELMRREREEWDDLAELMEDMEVVD